MATTSRSSKPAQKKPPAKKAGAAPQKKKAAAQVQPQQPPRYGSAPDKGAWREVVGIALFGIGLILTYFVAFDTASAIGAAISGVLRGLAGVVHYVVPAIVCWVGILVMFSSKRRLPNVFSALLVSVLVLCVCAAVHVFSFDAISQKLRFWTFKNFAGASYAYKGGAGVLGALLSWPLYHVLGLRAAGTIIALILIAVADLVLMQKISLSEIGERARARAVRFREGYQQRQEARAVQMAIDDIEQADEPDRDVDFDELEDWDGRGKPKKAEPVPPKQPTLIPPVREMEVPKFQPGHSVVSRRNPFSVQQPVEAESPEDAPQPIPGYLKKGRKKSQAPSLPEIMEPAPVLKALLPDAPAADPIPQVERVVSGSATFDGLYQDLPELRIGDSLDDMTPDFEEPPMDISDDDEPPFDLFDAEENPIDDDAEVGLLPADLKGHAMDLSKLPIAKPVQKAEPPKPILPGDQEPYNYPPIDLLAASKPSQINNQAQRDEEKAKVLIQTLSSFGIAARLIGIAHGPTVTRFELSPAAGVKVSRITALADDIALNLAAISVRIEAPIPGKAAVGVEVPNDSIEVVPLRDVLESAEARRHASRLAVGLGRDNAGRYIVGDLAKFPHVLIAGATGAGKSVCINSIICSILYRATPEEVKLIMIDPKVVELSSYNGIPHLLVPVVTDPKKAASALEWAVVEMGSRYKKFAERGVRDMKGFNQHLDEGEPPLPQIVIIIDELADLMMVTPGEVEDSICRLAQLARAAGIHLVIATQRPSVNVITGVIKANIPSRIAFTVASQVDSRTILDVGGAEKLLGRGDMLFAPSGTNKPQRVQGAWVSDDEVHDVVAFIKNLHHAEYDEDIIEHMESAVMSDAEKEDSDAEYDDLLPQAIEICVEAGQASISMLQRRLRVGYARAGRLIDEMAARGVVSQAEGAKPRSVLMTREQYRMMYGE